MTANREAIVGLADVRPTPKNKGVEMTVRIIAYDNGMIQVNGRPILASEGWLGAAEITTMMLAELQRESGARR